MIHQFDDYSLLRHNTFGIDAKTSRFIEYDTEEDLRRLISSGSITPPVLHIGQGSNLLFTANFEGTVLHSRIKNISVVKETEQEVTVHVGSGVVWDYFVAYCVERNWYGVENLSNIPGEVGASVVQNIGAYGVEVKDVVERVSYVTLDGCGGVMLQDECRFRYRNSIFKEEVMQHAIVTSVTFTLSKTEKYNLEYGAIKAELAKYQHINLQTVRQAIIDIRSAKLPDPEVLGNAGSFFMNPVVAYDKLRELQRVYSEVPFYELPDGSVKIPAAWLIEKSGWKGKHFGPTRMYEKQALVLVNSGGATGKDVVALSDQVRASVRNAFGINILPEVRFV